MTTTMAAAAAAVAAAAKAAQRLVLSDVRRRQDPERALRWGRRLRVAPTCPTDRPLCLLHARIRDPWAEPTRPQGAWLLAG